MVGKMLWAVETGTFAFLLILFIMTTSRGVA